MLGHLSNATLLPCGRMAWIKGVRGDLSPLDYATAPLCGTRGTTATPCESDSGESAWLSIGLYGQPVLQIQIRIREDPSFLCRIQIQNFCS